MNKAALQNKDEIIQYLLQSKKQMLNEIKIIKIPTNKLMKNKLY